MFRAKPKPNIISLRRTPHTQNLKIERPATKNVKRTQFDDQRTNQTRKRRKFYPHLFQKKYELFKNNRKNTENTENAHLL